MSEQNIFELFNIDPRISPWRSEELLVLGESRGTALNFDAACLSLPPNRYRINGFRQSFKYFNHVEVQPRLRKNLSFRNSSLVNNAKIFLSNVNTTIKTGDTSHLHRQVVGIHIRYGMAKARGFGGCIPTAVFYQRAIDYYRCRILFLVLSHISENVWCLGGASRM